MDRHSDVIVIGGGVIGVCVAHYLAEAGRSVRLIERNQIACGASDGNAGMIVPSHVVPLAAPGVIAKGLRWMFNPRSPFYIKPRLDPALLAWLWRFMRACSKKRADRAMPILNELTLRSRELFDTLPASQPAGFRGDGLLMVYEGAKGKKDCVETMASAQAMGLDVSLHEGEALKELEPFAPHNSSGGVFFRQDAHLDPERFVRELVKGLVDRVSVSTGAQVTGFTRKNGRITGVVTDGDVFTSDEVVVAAGSWSPELTRMLSLPLSMQPAKGYSLSLPASARQPKIPMILSERKVTITPMGDRIRFAGTLELGGLDDSIDRTRMSSILAAVPEYVPDFEPEKPDWSKIWSGFRPCAPDGLPYIGRPRRFDNLTVATGHGMLGVTLGPITGKLTAELISGDSPSLDLSQFDPNRF